MQNGEGKFCIFVGVWKNDETMMEFKDRRSIRKYSRRGLPEGLIEALAGEASRAATMGNMQLYSLVVTEDGPEREALAAAHHHQPMVEEAPAVLTFCADFHRFSRWCEQRDAAPGYGNFVSFINAATDTLLFAQAFITLGTRLRSRLTACRWRPFCTPVIITTMRRRISTASTLRRRLFPRAVISWNSTARTISPRSSPASVSLSRNAWRCPPRCRKSCGTRVSMNRQTVSSASPKKCKSLVYKAL